MLATCVEDESQQNKMKLSEINEKYLGREATIKLGGLEIKVIISDVKTSYGRDRFLVSPVSGSGQVWVEVVKLKK